MDWRLGALFIYRDQERYPECYDVWMVTKVSPPMGNLLNVVYTLQNITNWSREPYQVGSTIFDKCYKPLNSET
jgi:hypothetical protein